MRIRTKADAKSRHEPFRGFGLRHGLCSRQVLVTVRRPKGWFVGVQFRLNPLRSVYVMTQKIIEVIGTSKDSFAKAAENAVAEAAKTVRGIKWAHVDSLDMQLDGAKVMLYRAATKIYFDVEN